MKQNLPIKLTNTYKEAYEKYGWEVGMEGFCVDWNMLSIAEMSNKNIEFVIKRRRVKFVISPNRAKEVCRHHSSIFTRKRDKRVVAVIPRSECERVKI